MREKLEYEASTAAMIPRADVEQAVFEAGRIVRDAVLAPAELAATAVAERYPEVDFDQVERLVRRQLDLALQHAAAQLDGRADACPLTPIAGAAQITP